MWVARDIDMVVMLLAFGVHLCAVVLFVRVVGALLVRVHVGVSQGLKINAVVSAETSLLLEADSLALVIMPSRGTVIVDGAIGVIYIYICIYIYIYERKL